jgi:hypothetical protein
MNSSFKINLRDVLWWMFIKDACRIGFTIIVSFSKEGCISLIIGNNNNSLKIDIL